MSGSMNTRILRFTLLTLLCTMALSVAHAASTVQGRIYLKNGRIIECGEKDRIKLPKHAQDVKLLRRAFYKDKSKEVITEPVLDSSTSVMLKPRKGQYYLPPNNEFYH